MQAFRGLRQVMALSAPVIAATSGTCSTILVHQVVLRHVVAMLWFTMHNTSCTPSLSYVFVLCCAICCSMQASSPHAVKYCRQQPLLFMATAAFYGYACMPPSHNTCIAAGLLTQPLPAIAMHLLSSAPPILTPPVHHSAAILSVHVETCSKVASFSDFVQS